MNRQQSKAEIYSYCPGALLSGSADRTTRYATDQCVETRPHDSNTYKRTKVFVVALSCCCKVFLLRYTCQILTSQAKTTRRQANAPHRAVCLASRGAFLRALSFTSPCSCWRFSIYALLVCNVKLKLWKKKTTSISTLCFLFSFVHVKVTVQEDGESFNARVALWGCGAVRLAFAVAYSWGGGARCSTWDYRHKDLPEVWNYQRWHFFTIYKRNVRVLLCCCCCH